MQTERFAHVYSDSGPFATVFTDVGRDTETGEHEVDVRARNAADGLLAMGTPEAVVSAVRERLLADHGLPSPVSRIVVASERGVLFDDIVRVRLPKTTTSWHDLPDLAHWIACADRMSSFVLALVDHEGGTVHTYDAEQNAETELTAGHSGPHEHKTRGGGLSHRRYQRTAENVWAANAKAVADLMQTQLATGPSLVILAGDPTSRSEVRAALGEPTGVELVELDHGGRARDGGDGALWAEVEKALGVHAVAGGLTLAHELRSRLGRDAGAVTGVKNIAEAFVRGQVETLVLDPKEASRQLIAAQDYPGLELKTVPADQSVRADLALVAAAALTGAEVGVLPGRALKGACAAALLRWSSAPEATQRG